MTRLSEKRDVQDALINHLIGIGWEYLPPDEITDMRNGDEGEPFFVPIARQQLIALNPGLITPENADDVLRRLRGVHPSIAGNEERREAFVSLFKELQTTYEILSPDPFLKHPTHKSLQVLRLRESEQDGVVGGLGELGDDLHVAAGVNAGPEEHFLEEIRAHQT